MSKSPRDEAKLAIATWEGLYQHDRDDVGNTAAAGTMRGVTPAVLAAHRGIPLASVTKDVMLGVTLDEAADIYVQRYVAAPGLDDLPWAPSTAIAADFGWGSGPITAVRAQQRLAGVAADGVVGPATVAATRAWLGVLGHKGACDAWKLYRDEFYRWCVRARPSNQKFLIGWLNRSRWFSPSGMAWNGAVWWPTWQPLPPLPAAASAITASPPATTVPTPRPNLPPQRPWLTELGDLIFEAEEQTMAALFVASPGLGAAVRAIRHLTEALRK